MRIASLTLALCVVICASGCSFIDDFGSFTVASGDASVTDLGRDGGVPTDLGPDAAQPDLGEADLGPADLGPGDAGPIGTVEDIAAGSGYNCARFSSGRVRCWGSNSYGTLGNGDISGPPGVDQAMPQDVVGLPGPVVQIATGYGHACAIVDMSGARALYCWGDGGDGQFGTGGTEGYVSTPQRVDVGWQPQSVAAGGHFTCVIDTDHRVLCSGSNAYDQLGTMNPPTTGATRFAEPTTSLTPLNASAIVAGTANACVLNADHARCWGDGSAQQLATSATDRSPDALDVGPAEQIAIATWHMCSIDTGGVVMCWGFGDNGRLGDGTSTSSYMPVPVVAPLAPGGLMMPLQAIAIAAAEDQACAVYEDPGTGSGDVYCWGQNDAGELGVDTATAVVGTPRRIEGIDSVIKLAVGAEHVCALTSTRAVFCWGSNYYKELGPGSPFDGSMMPIRVTGLD